MRRQANLRNDPSEGGEFAIVPGTHAIYGGGDFSDILLESGPACGGQNQDGESPARKPLLKAKIAVRRDQDVKIGLGSREEFVVPQARPPHIKCRAHLVADE